MLQWRRRCISSSISRLESLDYCIVLFLYLDHVSSFDISPLILWDGSPLCVRYMVQHRNIFFTNAYVRSLLELSISFLHCCVNILTIDSLNKSINLFVSPIFCDSQIWLSPARSRTERIREHQFVRPMPSSSRSIIIVSISDWMALR